MDLADLPAMHAAYIECALWSSPNWGADADQPVDESLEDYEPSDAWLAESLAECQDFAEANMADLAAMTPEQAGHDFWLTRNGHGAGFWDRGLGELGKRLSDAAKVYGSVDLWLDADERVYAS